MKKKILIITIITFLLDIISKYVINNLLVLNKSIKVINKFFYLTYVHNEGAAWSMFESKRMFLILVSIFALIIIYRFIKDFDDNVLNVIAFGLLFGGIFGNLYDRLIFGYVRDFLDFKIFGYNYPIFNISDMCICFGTILLIVSLVKDELSGNKVVRRKYKN